MYYGFIPKPVNYSKPVPPIDGLINHADAHYLEWSLEDTKFLDAFKTFYPDWATRSGSIAEILIIDLENTIVYNRQPSGLIDKLIKNTINTRSACLEDLDITFTDD